MPSKPGQPASSLIVFPRAEKESLTLPRIPETDEADRRADAVLDDMIRSYRREKHLEKKKAAARVFTSNNVYDAITEEARTSTVGEFGRRLRQFEELGDIKAVMHLHRGAQMQIERGLTLPPRLTRDYEYGLNKMDMFKSYAGGAAALPEAQAPDLVDAFVLSSRREGNDKVYDAITAEARGSSLGEFRRRLHQFAELKVTDAMIALHRGAQEQVEAGLRTNKKNYDYENGSLKVEMVRGHNRYCVVREDQTSDLIDAFVRKSRKGSPQAEVTAPTTSGLPPPRA